MHDKTACGKLRKGKSATRHGKLLIGAASALTFATAGAQTAGDAQPERQEATAEVVVVGSQIKGATVTDTLPVTILEVEDIEVAGVRIPRGAEVALLFGSANRDETVFTDPDRLDVGRKDNPHISFGLGIHYCLGAPLARIEMVESFGVLLDRAPALELVREPEWKPGYIIRGLQSLELRTG